MQHARGDDTPAARVRRVIEEACNRGNVAALEAVLPLPVGRGATSPLRTEEPSLRAMLAAFCAAVPDARWTILEQITEGQTVVTRLAVRGTFSGPLLGLAPPGRPATLTGVAICRFAGERLAALWLQGDLLGLLVELELLPPLSLAQAVTMAQVAHAGARLAEDRAPPTHRRSVSRTRRRLLLGSAPPLDRCCLPRSPHQWDAERDHHATAR